MAEYDAGEYFRRRKQQLQPEPEDFEPKSYGGSSRYRYQLFAVAYACYMELKPACAAAGWKGTGTGVKALQQKWVRDMIDEEIERRKESIRLTSDDLLRKLERVIDMAMGDAPVKIARFKRNRDSDSQDMDDLLLESDSDDGEYVTYEATMTSLREAKAAIEQYGKHLKMWSDNANVLVNLPAIYLNTGGEPPPIEGQLADDPPQIADNHDDGILINTSGVKHDEDDWI